MSQAGLQCPSWPICYSPEMTVKGLLPTIHRILGGIVFITTLILFLRVRNENSVSEFKRKAALPLIFLFLEAGLGAVSALYKLPTVVTICHFILSIVYIVSLINLRFILVKESLTSERILELKTLYKAKDRHGVLFTFALFLLQALLGLLVRKSGAGKVCGLEPDHLFQCVEQGVGTFFLWPNSPMAELHMVHRMIGVLSLMSLLYFSIVIVLRYKKSRYRSQYKTVQNYGGILLAFSSIGFYVAKSVLGFENRELFIAFHYSLAVLSLIFLWFLNKKLEEYEVLAFPKGANTFLSDLVMLTKPRLASLVMVTVGVGILLAPKQINFFFSIFSFLLVFMVVMGAAVLNCYIERDVDGLMERTKDRPLPSGRMKPYVALIFGWACLLISLPLIYFYVNPATCYLSALAAALYLWAYTPMKQKSPSAVYIGAIPGAIPPILGWTIVMGEMDAMAWILFAILFVWQLPHFLAISIYHAEDYGAASIKVYPNQSGNDLTNIGIAVFTVVLGVVAYLPYSQGFATDVFAWVSVIVNGAFIILSFIGFILKDEAKHKAWARNYFWASIFYLPILLGSMIFFR